MEQYFEQNGIIILNIAQLFRYFFDYKCKWTSSYEYKYLILTGKYSFGRVHFHTDNTQLHEVVL